MTDKDVAMLIKASMITAIVLATCAGAAGTYLWARSEPRCGATPAAALSMPSIEELHARAHAKTLPDQTVKEPY
jgi:hypothetical protein